MKIIFPLLHIILAALLLKAIVGLNTEPRELIFKAQVKQQFVELGDDAECTSWDYKKSRYVKCVWKIPQERIDLMNTYAFNEDE